MNKLRLILGDQLNDQHSWFEQVDQHTTYCMFEMKQETNYVRHHTQKVIAFFLAMRNFAKNLRAKGHEVIYFELDDPANRQQLDENLNVLIKNRQIQKFEYQLPDEYRLDQQLQGFCKRSNLTYEVFDSEHFLSKRTDLAKFFEGKKTYLMESFYRHMRKKYDVLMEGEKPITGKWNYDHDNRKRIPKDHIPPPPKTFPKKVVAIQDLINQQGVETIGTVDPENFIWPMSRAESLELLDFFIQKCLPHFGTFQDAMTPHYWSLYHSRLSFSLNSKMLHPLELVKAVEHYWLNHQEEVSIAQAEGFIRQIIGWREYMRGVYWAKMPTYATLNYFEHDRKLPNWFWTGKTKMHCLSHAIQQSLEYAYAHHIQRLMVTGNFALLAGVHPNEVDAWYLGIYIDAIEWVEITNTRGMSQFADGGIVGTKPYVSSANYINKMSHYCKTCFYDPKIKRGPKACPFNSLYWNFYEQHRAKLVKNPRIGMAYRLLNKMDETQKALLMQQAALYLENIEEL